MTKSAASQGQSSMYCTYQHPEKSITWSYTIEVIDFHFFFFISEKQAATARSEFKMHNWARCRCHLMISLT